MSRIKRVTRGAVNCALLGAAYIAAADSQLFECMSPLLPELIRLAGITLWPLNERNANLGVDSQLRQVQDCRDGGVQSRGIFHYPHRGRGFTHPRQNRHPSSAEAAEALKPVAGRFAFMLFSMGIVGTGLLAVPVLAGATAFTAAGTMRAPYGREHKPKKAKIFYGVLVASMLTGALLNLTPIDPIKALCWSAIVNGVCAVPMMIAIMVIARSPKTMGRHGVGRRLHILGWAATLVMLVAAVVMFATMGKGS